jgi:hypothetical protein
LLVKVAANQLILTPPLLLLTLGSLRWFQSGLRADLKDIRRQLRATYAAALFQNWRLWSVAQAVNIAVVPADYRVLFSNVVTLWWNIFLSTASHTGHATGGELP